ncbi:hypothetical protein [Embleya sp. NPDC020630]|uniref:hypothetical protein n=1 Tax=Embleya sp. NPDC020630 TaxID=3363979 RepID=UPI0037B9B5EE
MNSSRDDIRHALDTLSHEARPLREMPRETLTREADRRRRRRRLRTAAAATAVAVCGVGVVAAIVRGADSADRSTSAAAPTPPDAPAWGTQEPGPFTCGRPLGYPTTEQFEGFGLSPLRIERTAPDGPPKVEADLESPSPNGLNATEVYPVVVVLRDGIVVGGPVEAGALPPGRMLRSPDWPAWSRTIRQPTPAWLCGAVTWQQVWAEPGKYTVALVMTPPTTDGNRPGGRAIDASNPLLISTARLDALP